jgi:hypothetical protein
MLQSGRCCPVESRDLNTPCLLPGIQPTKELLRKYGLGIRGSKWTTCCKRFPNLLATTYLPGPCLSLSSLNMQVGRRIVLPTRSGYQQLRPQRAAVALDPGPFHVRGQAVETLQCAWGAYCVHSLEPGWAGLGLPQ